jgi:hypothetical protein
MSRGDLKGRGEALDEGTAELVVMGESKIDEQIEKATKRARRCCKTTSTPIPAALKQEIEAAEKQEGGR